jgi:hypothetical protein
MWKRYSSAAVTCEDNPSGNAQIMGKLFTTLRHYLYYFRRMNGARFTSQRLQLITRYPNLYLSKLEEKTEDKSS